MAKSNRPNTQGKPITSADVGEIELNEEDLKRVAGGEYTKMLNKESRADRQQSRSGG
jgi:hypothetical protein